MHKKNMEKPPLRTVIEQENRGRKAKVDITKNFRKSFSKFSNSLSFWIYLHMVITFIYYRHVFTTKIVFFLSLNISYSFI